MRSAKIWFSLSAHEVLQVDHEVLNVRAGPFRKQFLAQGPGSEELALQNQTALTAALYTGDLQHAAGGSSLRRLISAEPLHRAAHRFELDAACLTEGPEWIVVTSHERAHFFD